MLQVSYDCSIITTFEAINDVPVNYLLYRTVRPKTSITVPPNTSQKISCLKSFVILSANNDKTLEFLSRIEIVNETKDTKWIYSKHFIGIPETKNTLIWTTSWKFLGDELEAGDHISLKVLSDFCVIQFAGIELVYDYEPDDKCNSLYQLQRMSKISSFLSEALVYLLFKSQRTLYRMQSLVKE